MAPLDALEAQVHDDVGAHLAVQGDDGGDVLEVEDVDRLAADLAEHDVAGGDLTDGRHDAAFPAVDDLGGFLFRSNPCARAQDLRRRPRPRRRPMSMYGSTAAPAKQSADSEPERDH